MLLFDKCILEARCGVWHVTESIDGLLALLPCANQLWQEAQMRFKSDSRRQEWIAVRVLLHTMGKDATRIVYADNGAPRLDGCDTHISISHTKGYVCVALSDSCRIGVDIEQVSHRVERVSSRFLNEEEGAESLMQLLVAWSAKESAYKLLQRTEVDFKEHLRISGMPAIADGTCCEGTFPLAYINNEERIECTVAYEVFSDFVLTLARY